MIEILSKWIDINKAYSTEGRRGLINLCKLARALGYEDDTKFGDFGEGAYLGDLLVFLEDNSGAIDSVVNWVFEHETPEWKASLTKSVIDAGSGPDLPPVDEDEGSVLGD
jgi:hypothetical protein